MKGTSINRYAAMSFDPRHEIYLDLLHLNISATEYTEFYLEFSSSVRSVASFSISSRLSLPANIRIFLLISSGEKPCLMRRADSAAPFASSTGPQQPTQGIPYARQTAPHPARVIGPRQGRFFSVRRQRFSFHLHSVQTGKE